MSKPMRDPNVVVDALEYELMEKMIPLLVHFPDGESRILEVLKNLKTVQQDMNEVLGITGPGSQIPILH